ncbi:MULTISPECIES: sugar O-acetyltransferase [Aerococcus]|uniref:Acetyltransferase n=1 Tax=Aerococcus sanguinicola TaxID=119206 RepID=A0A5N1GMI3_9LACT|nr:MULTISPECIES: sugar O-acetyltransferase [Aerococcus]KAA9302177.1 sugar O-acetyltransferase [Aerococcus sanguinicola]MDK6368393.1 sugar O-acetyltransferase [Aerococcus sp. UMB9870]MDK6679475.1 sugar O-acetyltransferase [Aerococcus sp. UMB8608]MDK6687242.1 sugar O-acetyltransferase [Aerococcus sp. UMB8623]MDK6941060.1 sugar O-acetyltransferase [Aerococcus sp. UMB8487]
MLSHYERMRSGQWYDANYDAAILAKREEAKAKAHRFNQVAPTDPEAGAEALADLLGPLPEGLEVMAPIYVDYGDNVRFGRHCFVNHACYFMDGAAIEFGDHVFIGPYCGFYTAAHPLTAKPRNAGLEQARPITVGSDCWFGANVSVMPGVSIGSGSVIGAGTVLTKDIPENSLVMGVPGRVIKTIDQDQVNLFTNDF